MSEGGRLGWDDGGKMGVPGRITLSGRDADRSERALISPDQTPYESPEAMVQRTVERTPSQRRAHNPEQAH